MSASLVAFCSDFGLDDPFVGLCHAAMLAVEPGTRIVDLTHGIPPQDIAAGALVLADAAPWLPRAVLMAVVDPGVGTDRRGIVVAIKGNAGGVRASDRPRLLVGPDNGLLIEAANVLGGIGAAWALRPAELPSHHGMTFDGRDLFAPAAARLAAGANPGALGEAIEPATLVTLRQRHAAALTREGIDTHVRAVDRYGNAQLTAPAALLAEAGLTPGEAVVIDAAQATTYGRVTQAFANLPPAGLGVLPDAFGRIQIALRDGDAAAALGLHRGAAVRLSLG
ncbi:MAG: SAM-dependent chlorinase/fluorinase [Euzebyales bacterium]|nr:SAM-dependent chlorinase/fluorinase [Euzebyales bacterium]